MDGLNSNSNSNTNNGQISTGSDGQLGSNGQLSSRPLLFAINGERVELPLVDPSLTLLSYLRLRTTALTGTKFSCGEGGCGACVVLLCKYNVERKEVEEMTINSCLTLLCSLDGCAIITTEGLGSTQKGFHSVHKRLAGFHGSQCGFCTPGMSMSLYACIRKAQQNQPSSGDCNAGVALHTLPGLSLSDAQQAIAGNICRCTGYRPILDTCKSFSGEVDVEDLGLNSFWTPGMVKAELHSLPPYEPSKDPSFPQFLVKELEERYATERGHLTGEMCPTPQLTMKYVDGIKNREERIWITPSTLDGVFEALEAHEEVKLVVGNTSAGIYKNIRPHVYVDISRIPELLVIEDTPTGLEVGASVTIDKLILALELRVGNMIQNPEFSVYAGIARHLRRVGNSHIRNRASVAGNLLMAQKFAFDSDIATILLGAGASVKLKFSNKKALVLDLEEFLSGGLSEKGVILHTVIIPTYPQAFEALNNGTIIRQEVEGNGKCVYKTYRAAPRRLGNAVAYVNAAFYGEFFELANGSGLYILSKARLAFGAFGQKHAVRAREVEDFLVGNKITAPNLLRAIEILKSISVVPPPGTTKAAYRSSVAVGFFFDFFSPFLHHPLEVKSSINPPIHHNGKNLINSEQSLTDCNGIAQACGMEVSGAFKVTNTLNTSGKQKFELSTNKNPIGQPVSKFAAEIQAAGEAVYVDDISAPESCLFAAFVYSKEAFAKIKSIDLESALASPGSVSYISANDIPLQGNNIGVIVFGPTDKLFATDFVEYFGQPIGLMVADTPQHAKDAAEKVEVQYERDSLDSPVLSIEEAVERKSFHFIPPNFVPKRVGDTENGFSESDHRIEHAEVRTGSQYYFYMENQAALALPDEDDCMLVYSSCQSPETTQQSVAACLGVPSNNIRIITRRVGGGFGGKAFRSVPIAVACAVAAQKLRRPVRMSLDRNTDMIMMGGRHPTKTIYSVGFKSTGKITALRAELYIEGGWFVDLGSAMPNFIEKGLKKYNWGTLDVIAKVCKTNLPPKSAMRAPGDIQGSFIADTIIEHVASVLGLDTHVVIEENMHTLESAAIFYDGSDVGGIDGYTLPSIWKTLRHSISEREKEVKIFNRGNKWLKRGLSIIPCIYEVLAQTKPARVSILSDGSVVVEVGGVEIGQGLWTKAKQTAIHGLSPLLNGKGLDALNIRIVQTDSISLPNGGLTAGSTTSEGSCEAVRQACAILVERMMPAKASLEEQNPNEISWKKLVNTAKFSQINLSAQIHYFPPKNGGKYLNYGAAATEVELNSLTGETTILQTDLIYDCGKSMNPAVDLGQIEGAFVQGIGFFVTEEHVVNDNGRVVSDGTWTYKPPTVDNIPQKFNVQLFSGPMHHNRILSSKACGEPPLLLAGSVHSAIRRSIEAAVADSCKPSIVSNSEAGNSFFRMDTPATMERVKSLCHFDMVETYLHHL